MTTSIEDDRGEAGHGPGSPTPAEPRPARELLPLVYDELRRLAAQRMARRRPVRRYRPRRWCTRRT